MTELYKHKYRIKSARLAGWDYGHNGAYFVTICTAHRHHYFGEIIHDKMILNELGQTAHSYWLEIPNHFPFVRLGNHVIMPNHVHGIIIIDKPYCRDVACNVSTNNKCNVSTNNACSTKSISSSFRQSISPKKGSLATIIRSYKSAVTRHVRKIHADFGWQTRFHDHIIRDSKNYQKISHYIESNPQLWKQDKFYL